MKSERLVQATKAVLEGAAFDRAVQGFVIEIELYTELRQAFEDLEERVEEGVFERR